MLKKFLIGTFVAMALMLASTAFAAYDFGPSTLKVGSSGDYVKTLQTFVGATADGSFGPMTKAKVVAWQSNNGLTADGLFGNMSKAKANEAQSNFPAGCTNSTGFSSITGASCATTVSTLPAGCTAGAMFSSTTGVACATVTTLPAGCTTAAGFSPTTGASCGIAVSTGVLTGGAGNVSEVKKDSTYSLVELTSGQTDVKVSGFTIKADTGSDVAIQTLSLNLSNTDASPSSTNMSHFFDSVSIWEGSTKVGTANLADFSKSGIVYSRTIQLSGAVVRAGATSEFYITVNSASNIDSTDLAAGANKWQPEVTSIRYVDGTGAIMTDSATGIIGGATDLSSFSFVDISVATGKELKIVLTTGQDAINKAHVALVSTTTTTNDVPLLAFDIKAKGQINHITSLPFGVVSSGTGSVNEIASSFSLWKDGVKVDTVDVADGYAAATYGEYSTDTSIAACAGTSTQGCSLVFNNIDFSVADGSTTHMVIKANLQKIIAGSAFTEGDTLLADINTAALTDIVAEDVNTDAFVIGSGDMTGSATAEAVKFRSIGISVALAGTPSVTTTNIGGSASVGTYSISFDVTAFGADQYVSGMAPTVAGTSNGTTLVVNSPSSGNVSLSAEITSPTGATRADSGTGVNTATSTFLVSEGTTQRFTVTAIVSPTSAAANGLNSVSITEINFGADSATEADTTYTTNLTSFVTPSANLKYVN